MLDAVYNARLLELVSDIPRQGRLDAPDGTATVRARLCGSTVTVDVRVDADGRVSDLAQDVRACALGQASASLVGRHAVGMHAEAIRALRDTVRHMLKDGGPAPTGDLADFGVLEPVRDLRARHASTLLPLDAVVAAVDDALSSGGPDAERRP